jgi:hypothetical protein
MTDTSSTSPESIFKPVIAGLARHAFTAAAGALASYGLIQPDQMTQFEDGGVAVVLFLAGAAWSYWQKRQAAKPSTAKA